MRNALADDARAFLVWAPDETSGALGVARGQELHNHPEELHMLGEVSANEELSDRPLLGK